MNCDVTNAGSRCNQVSNKSNCTECFSFNRLLCLCVIGSCREYNERAKTNSTIENTVWSTILSLSLRENLTIKKNMRFKSITIPLLINQCFIDVSVTTYKWCIKSQTPPQPSKEKYLQIWARWCFLVMNQRNQKSIKQTWQRQWK